MGQENSWALGEEIPMYRVTVETSTSKTVIELTDDLSTDTVAYEVLLPVIMALTFMPSQLPEIVDGLSEIVETKSVSPVKNESRWYI
jgi:hypothetical protein